MRLSEFYTLFEVMRSISRAHGTTERNRNLLRQFILYMRNCEIESVTNIDIVGFLHSLSVLGWHQNTIMCYSIVLRKFFQYAASQKVSSVDHSVIPIPKKVFSQPRVLKDEDYTKVMGSIPEKGSCNIRNKALYSLLYDTGARIGEALSLRTEDIKERTAIIKTEKNRGSRPFRPIYWRHNTERLMQLWLKARGQWVDDTNNLVFIGVARKKGLPLRSSSINQYLAKQCKKVGIEPFTAHSFRHRFCRDVIKRGGDASAVMNLAGHVSISSSVPYVALFGDEVKKSYENIFRDDT